MAELECGMELISMATGTGNSTATSIGELYRGQEGLQNEEKSDMLHPSSELYSEGPLKIGLFPVASDAVLVDGLSEVTLTANGPPRPLLIATPTEAGEYPVIVFQHAFMMENTFYTQLMSHLASHGFIVVAPQMIHDMSESDATREICLAASVIDWLASGLAEALSKLVASVKPDLENLALVGHSRGGKVVFGLATGVCKSTLKYSAIAGLDPVDGTGIDKQTNPPILQFSPHSLKLGIPILIVGAALGSLRSNILVPPCAPEGVSHDAFFADSGAPSFHFVASEYGHMDYLNDDTGGILGLFSKCFCKNGPSRAPMRRFAAGILVAFLRASLLNDGSQLDDAIANPSLAPVKLELPETYGTLSSVSKVLITTG